MTPSRPAKDHAFEPSEYIFTSDHVTHNITVWNKLLEHFPQQPRRALEIGAAQGRSVIWLIENKLKSGDEIYVIDPWQRGMEEDGLSFEEKKFDHNINIALKKTPGIKFVKRKGKSRFILPQMLTEGMADTFDFIYVDGCHDAPSVLEDLIFSNLLCKTGGLILCDDYLWDYCAPLTRTPKLAIDAFANCFREKVEIIRDIPLFQVCFRKVQE